MRASSDMSVLQFPHTTSSSFSVQPSVYSKPLKPYFAYGSSPFSPFLSLYPVKALKNMSNVALFSMFVFGICVSFYAGRRSSPVSSPFSSSLGSECVKEAIGDSVQNSSFSATSTDAKNGAGNFKSDVEAGTNDVKGVENEANDLKNDVQEAGSDVTEVQEGENSVDDVESEGKEKRKEGAEENSDDPAAILESFTKFSVKCAEEIPYSEVKATVIKWGFEGQDPYTDFPPKEIKPRLRKHLLRGWDSTENVFRNLISEVKPKVIVELGSFLGASAVHMANVSRELGYDPIIFCLDDFRGWLDLTLVPKINGHSLLLYQFMQNVMYSGFQDNILPIPASISTGVKNLCGWGIRADLIEVDASHDFYSVWFDLNMAHSLLSDTGVMFGHDILKSEVKRAVTLFGKLRGYRVERQGKHWVYRASRKPGSTGR